VFGAVTGPDGQSIVDSISQNDRIEGVDIEGDTSELFAKTQKQVDEWNAVLDKKFPRKG